MTEGHTLDHDTPAGRLMTVFSAPDYPQFVPESHARYNNKAALAVLTAPDYAAPTFLQFEAVRPRPMVGSGDGYQSERVSWARGRRCRAACAVSMPSACWKEQAGLDPGRPPLHGRHSGPRQPDLS